MWFIINPFSRFKSVWNIILLFVMFFNAMVVPIRLAFSDDITFDFYIYDVIIDSMFIVEFLSSFFTAYQNSNGKIVSNVKDIFCHYLKGNSFLF